MELIEGLIAATALSGGELALLLLIVLGAAVIRGYAGFGFSAITVASASLFVPTREAVPLVLLLEVVASVQMARQVWKYVDWRLVGYILIGVVVFSPLGQLVLRTMDVDVMRLVVAVLLFAAIAAVSAGRFFTIKNAPSGWMLTGVVSGFMNGVSAMGGMWTVVFLLNAGVQVAVLRACLVVLFFITDCYALTVATVVYDLVDTTLLARAVCVLPALLLGVKLGAGRFDAQQQAVYKKVVLGILMLLAVLLVARAAGVVG